MHSINPHTDTTYGALHKWGHTKEKIGVDFVSYSTIKIHIYYSTLVDPEAPVDDPELLNN